MPASTSSSTQAVVVGAGGGAGAASGTAETDEELMGADTAEQHNGSKAGIQPTSAKVAALASERTRIWYPPPARHLVPTLRRREHEALGLRLALGGAGEHVQAGPAAAKVEGRGAGGQRKFALLAAQRVGEREVARVGGGG